MTTIVEEAAASTAVSQVPRSHLSIEVGHLYLDDFQRGPDRIAQLLAQAAPWERRAREACTEALGPTAARVSTCLLIDDYFTDVGSPRVVVPQILSAAEAAGLRIDYLAREAGCAHADGIDIATDVLRRLVPDPPRGATGRRPDVFTSGWLCNGQRNAHPDVAQAMLDVGEAWTPPVENGANRHSIFVDVQLWDDKAGVRTWACAYLASVWQLLRLGLLRHDGASVATPRTWDEPEYPERWRDLPPILQLSARPAPFCAFRTHSVLASRFLPTEQAVRTILSQVDVGAAIREQTLERAATERPPIAVPAEIIDRISYDFTGPAWR